MENQASRIKLPAKYKNAKKNADGSLAQFMPKVDGKFFRCSCGCNVFHKPDATNDNLFECNSCKARYESEQQ